MNDSVATHTLGAIDQYRTRQDTAECLSFGAGVLSVVTGYGPENRYLTRTVRAAPSPSARIHIPRRSCCCYRLPKTLF